MQGLASFLSGTACLVQDMVSVHLQSVAGFVADIGQVHRALSHLADNNVPSFAPGTKAYQRGCQ